MSPAAPDDRMLISFNSLEGDNAATASVFTATMHF